MKFLSFNEEELAGPEDLRFKDGEVVKMRCLDFMEDQTKGDLKLTCAVLTGDHVGKQISMFISNRPHEVAQKIRRQFALAFWTKEQLLSGDAQGALLIGRVFTAKSRVSPPKEVGGQTFQNWGSFRDLGNEADAPHTDDSDMSDIPF